MKEKKMKRRYKTKVSPEKVLSEKAFGMTATVTVEWNKEEPIMKKERYYVLSDSGKKPGSSNLYSDGEGGMVRVPKNPKKPRMRRKDKGVKVNPKPRVVVCLIEDHDGNTARGVSVCSLSDKWNLEEGKSTAYLYAVDALCSETTFHKVRRERSLYVVNRVLHNENKFMRVFELDFLDFDEISEDELDFLGLKVHSYYKPRLTMFEMGVMEVEEVVA